MLQSSSSSFRGEMMARGGGDSGIRTVECLRGRLLAERVASKAAKEEADLMAKRLDGLEKQLAEEIKSRNRAKKRLKHALKKLKSLNLLSFSESSAGSSGSWKSDSGALDSSGQCGSGGEVEEMRRVMGMKDVGGNYGFDSSSGDSANQMVSQEGSWSSAGTAHSWSKEALLRDEESSDKDHEDSIPDGARHASHNVDEQNNSVQQAEHSNDMLALVPVTSTPVNSGACRSDVSSANVQNVLVALHHVKELLRNSMERRAAAVSHPKALYGLQ